MLAATDDGCASTGAVSKETELLASPDPAKRRSSERVHSQSPALDDPGS
jgi:hypothetical protein